jgi:hypothetical protein
MAGATLSWRNQHAGVKLSSIKSAVDKMVTVAKKTKDLNNTGEAEKFELKKAVGNNPRLLKVMESIRSGSGFWARDAVSGGNPYFSYNEFLDNYRDMKATFTRMDADKNGKLDAKELRGANSKMKQAVIEYVDR